MPHDAIRIRLATRADAEVIAGHRLSMFTDMGTLPAGADVDALRRAAAAYLRDAIGSEYFEWLACVDDDVVGGCGMQLRRILPRFSRGGAVIDVEGIILNVYTDAAWRRRGVAEELVRACLAWARGRGIERIVLHASPEGRRLYEKLGFVQTNEMRLHHS